MTTQQSQQQKKRVLVPIANGTEEIEATSIIDTLRRAGAEVVVASVEEGLKVVCSRGVKIEADVLLKDVANVRLLHEESSGKFRLENQFLLLYSYCMQEEWDLISLPGGAGGAERFRDSEMLKNIVLKQQKNQKLVSAICASPVVALQPYGVLTDQSATSHPNFFSKLKNPNQSRVVVNR